MCDNNFMKKCRLCEVISFEMSSVLFPLCLSLPSSFLLKLSGRLLDVLPTPSLFPTTSLLCVCCAHRPGTHPGVALSTLTERENFPEVWMETWGNCLMRELLSAGLDAVSQKPRGVLTQSLHVPSGFFLMTGSRRLRRI